MVFEDLKRSNIVHTPETDETPKGSSKIKRASSIVQRKPKVKIQKNILDMSPVSTKI